MSFLLPQQLHQVLKSQKSNNIINKVMHVGGGTKGKVWRSLLGDRCSGTILH